MPVFKYKAANASGTKKKGILDAANRTQAARKLRDQGLYPIEVILVKSKGGGNGTTSKSRLPLHLLRRVSREAIAATIRQLATLLNAGLPLDKALDAVIKSERKQTDLQRVFTEIREAIREGSDLATAFSKHPHVFSTTFVTMVRAGESSGTLDIVMERLAEHIDQQVALRRKVQATMAYPTLMLIVGVCVVVFLLSFVVPKVTEIFIDMERTLPLPTRILLATSDLFRQSWGILLAIVAAIGFVFYRFQRTERGRAAYHAFLLRVPLLGKLICQLSVARFTKTLGMLLKNGVPLVGALEIVRNVVDNEIMKDVIETIRHDVQEGKPLAGPLDASDIFEHAAVQMIAAGEQSGRLDEMLILVSKNCDDKVDATLQMLTSLMEPIMILLLGGMVGFVVLAIMLPIFEMSNLVGL